MTWPAEDAEGTGGSLPAALHPSPFIDLLPRDALQRLWQHACGDVPPSACGEGGAGGEGEECGGGEEEEGGRAAWDAFEAMEEGV